MKWKKSVRRLCENYYIRYTGAFCVMAAAVFLPFFCNKKTFIHSGDGWLQHFQAILYYSRYLRSIIANFLTTGTLSLPTYSFHLGYGADLMTTLQYYVIGDPICLLAAAVPIRWMEYFYGFAILLRLYLAGIAFSLYCFYRNKRENPLGGESGREAVGVGTLVYVFCGYALMAGLVHPYFGNPMIYFPLVLLGVEKILGGESPFPLILSVCLAAGSNFYFFYMIVILTVLYVIWRVLTVYRGGSAKAAAAVVGRITLFSLLGTLMAAVLLLPVIRCFLEDARLSVHGKIDLLYPINEWKNALIGFVSVNSPHFRVMGYAPIALLAVGVLFLTKKRNTDLKTAFLVLSAMLMIPAAGSFMNGFAYVTNRWIWGYSMLVAFIVVQMWNRVCGLDPETVAKLAAVTGGYFLLCVLLPQTVNVSGLVSLGMAFFMVCVLFCGSTGIISGRKMEKTLAACVAGSIVLIAFFYYSPVYDDYSGAFVSMESVDEKQWYTEQNVVQAADEEESGFFRYSGDVSENLPLNGTQYSTQYYWSLSNPYIVRLRRDLEIADICSQRYFKPDSRTILSALDNVRYYVQEENPGFGYARVDPESLREGMENKEWLLERYALWENAYALPFGYTYADAISEEAFQPLSPLEKAEAMLQAVVLSEETGEAARQKRELSFHSKSVPYEMAASEGIQAGDGSFIVEDANETVTLTFRGDENAETYLRITGLRYCEDTAKDAKRNQYLENLNTYDRRRILREEKNKIEDGVISFQCSAENTAGETVSVDFQYGTPAYDWWNGSEDFTVNLGYDAHGKTAITITFREPGVYTFRSLEVLCQPMDAYPEQVMALAEDVLEDVDFHDGTVYNATNRVTGRIVLEEAKYLLLSIPYGKGWTAYVNGVKQPLYRANTMYMALYLQPGAHEIELRYETPGLKAGAAVSLASTAIAAAYAAYWFRWKKRRREDVR